MPGVVVLDTAFLRASRSQHRAVIIPTPPALSFLISNLGRSTNTRTNRTDLIERHHFNQWDLEWESNWKATESKYFPLQSKGTPGAPHEAWEWIALCILFLSCQINHVVPCHIGPIFFYNYFREFPKELTSFVHNFESLRKL